MKTSYAAVLAFLASASAHMMMGSPVPFNKAELDNSPLNGDGSNFPCKVAGGKVDVSKGTQVPLTVGSPNTLSFIGSAVHGGGSCQVSLASGSTVDASTKWMVIASYEGGCPADMGDAADQNLPANAAGTGAGSFQYTIPKHSDIKDGNYVLAWTWHNRIGNREMYMNCANVKISGSGSAKKRYAPSSFATNSPAKRDAPLPDMFKANIGNGCATPANFDVQYPDAGAQLLVGKNAKLAAPVGNCGASGSSSPAQPAAGSSSAAVSASASVIGSATGSASAAPTGANSIAPISQSVGNGFATVPAGGATPTSASSAAATVSASSAAAQQSTQAASAASVAPVAPISTGTPATGGTAPAAGGSCTTGDWNCAADGKSFTRCIAGGTWSASIPMSAGLSCTPGISASFAYNLTGSSAKRDMRSHIARRRAGMHGAALS